MSYRKVTLSNGQVWEWQASGPYGYNVILRSPEGKKHIVSMADLKGVDQSVIERGYHKETDDCAIKPGRVKTYIEILSGLV